MHTGLPDYIYIAIRINSVPPPKAFGTAIAFQTDVLAQLESTGGFGYAFHLDLARAYRSGWGHRIGTRNRRCKQSRHPLLGDRSVPAGRSRGGLLAHRFFLNLEGE